MTLSVSLKAERPIPLDVDFRVAPGELLALVGPSGSGKSTILRSIAGLWTPRDAEVAVDDETWVDSRRGVNLPPYRRHLGMVFQSYGLFPHMSAAQNIAAVLPRPDQAEVARLLDLLGLQGLGDRRPAALSGGQQQRVAVARAMARKPKALLLDEPFSAVDRATRERLYAQIRDLRAHLRMPVVLVTHDMGEAQLLADRMVVIEAGRLVRQGSTAEVMTDPAALRVMGLRDLAALLPAVVDRPEEDGLTRLQTAVGPLFLPGIDSPEGSRLSVRIPAHEVILARQRPVGLSAQNILPGRITALRPGEGPGVLVQVTLGEDPILARITRRAATELDLKTGDPVFVILKAMSVARDQIRDEG
jgi:molybdate transport system ATP-binding protein